MDARPTSLRIRSSLPLLLLAGVALIATGCQNGDDEARADDRSTTPAADGSDATAAADSTLSPADSSAAPAPKTRGWRERLFGENGTDAAEEEEPAIPVETALVARRDIPAYLASTATLEPEKEATIPAKIAGQLQRIRVEEGDWVESGAVLAELDGAEQGVRLEEAAARARGLELELDRVRALHAQDLASDKQLNDAQAAYDQAEANRKAMQLQVEFTRIRAPFAGQVSRRMVDPGQSVETGTDLFTVVDRSPLLARIHLPESEVRGLETGQAIWIVSEREGEETELPGSVVRVAPVVDTRTGTVKVTCEMEDDGDRMRPGSFVRVKVRTGMHEDVLAVPKRALVPEGAETFVYRAEADSVVKVPVETGFSDAEFVEVVAGLEDGDRIVTVGHGGLKPGAKIEDLTAVREGGSSPDGSLDTGSLDTASRDR